MSKLKIFSLYLLGGVLVVSAISFAGSLSPSSSPSPTTHSLNDIYQKLIDNSYTESIPADFNFPTGEATSTMFTVEDIWNAIPEISSSTIISGETILGIDGIYNTVGLTPDRVASGTSYGVGLTGTMLSGNPLFTRVSLQWSPTFGPMTWIAATAYCSTYDNKQSWRLPTRYELNAAVYYQSIGSIDPSQTPGDFLIDTFPAATNRYWSMTEGDMSGSYTSYVAIICGLSDMGGSLVNMVGEGEKTNSYKFRCVK